MPALEIPWWDINADSARTTTLPATRFEVATVEGVLPSEQAVASTQEIQALLAPEPIVDQAMIDAQAEAEVIEIDSGIVRWAQWLVVALVIFLLSALARRRFGALIQQRFAEWRAAQTPEANEKAAYGKLKSACHSGDHKAIRDSLLTWAIHYCASERGGQVRSMEDLVRLSPLSRVNRTSKGAPVVAI